MSEKDYKEFAETVAKMRQAQKEYFKHQQPEALKRSKRLEGYVDAWLERINPTDNQGLLF